MGKLDRILDRAGAHIAESMGAGQPAPGASHGASPAGPPPVPARLQGIAKLKSAVEIPIDKIDRDPAQPREEFDAESLGRLAESLKAKGLLQPVRARWSDQAGKYILIAGERRWRAARLAGLPTISAIVVDEPIAAGELLSLQVIENCLREDLKPIEQARAFRKLMELHSWSARQVARELALTQSFVARALALLELPEPVQDLVEQGALAPATACEIARLDHPDDQQEVAGHVVAERLTRDQAIAAVRAKKIGKPAKAVKRAKQVEFRVPGGKVIVLPDDPATDLVSLLERALDQARAESRQEAA